MNISTYFEIKYELELMKRELKARLKQEQNRLYRMETSEEYGLVMSEEEAKRKTLLHHIQEDLKDVERALLKMEIGMYGVCEETGKLLPLEQLRIMPTARTADELLYERLKTV